MDRYIKDALGQCRVIDYETTSLDPFEAEVIEAGIALFDPAINKWTMHGELYSAAGAVPVETQAVCLIHPSMLEGKDQFVQVKHEFFSFIDSGYVVAHNAIYEKLVMEAYGNKLADEKFICTLRLAKKILPNLEWYKLPELRYYLDLSHDEPKYHNLQMHRAHHDAYFTGKLLETFIEIMVSRGIVSLGPNLIDDVAAYAQAPIIFEKVPFGKHRGKDFSDVPEDYWSWCFENMEQFNDKNPLSYDEDLVMSVARALGMVDEEEDTPPWR